MIDRNELLKCADDARRGDELAKAAMPYLARAYAEELAKKEQDELFKPMEPGPLHIMLDRVFPEGTFVIDEPAARVIYQKGPYLIEDVREQVARWNSAAGASVTVVDDVTHR